jgi:TatA/E family protein of Tat protein translocase
MPSVPEILIILFIVLVVFGSSRLGTIGDALGRAVRGLLGKDSR